MANLIRIQHQNAPGISDPYGDAQRQQDYADLITAHSLRPHYAGTGTNAQAIQMGLTQLAEALLGHTLQNKAGEAADSADASQRQANEAKLDALVPAMIKGGQINGGIRLEGLGDTSPPQTFTAPDLAHPTQAPTPATLPQTDQATIMPQSLAVPDQLNPAHAQLAAALAGVDPRVAGQTLSAAVLRNALPDPEKAADRQMRSEALQAAEADRQAARDQAAAIAKQASDDRRYGIDSNNQARRDAAAARAQDKAGTDADAEDGMRDRAAKIVAYEAAPPSGMGSNSPSVNKLWKYIHEEEQRVGKPYDATKYTTYQRGRNAFTSGKQSDQVRSLDVAVRHMDTLESMVDALHNKDFVAFNALGNAAGVQMGDTPVTNYNMGANILGKEVEKALIANGGTGHERTEAVQKFSANASPQQMHEGFTVARKFLNGQLKGFMRQGSAATGWDESRLRQELQLPDSLSDANLNAPGGQAAPAKTKGGATVSNW